MPRLATLQSFLGLRFIAAATLPLLLFGIFAYQYLARAQLEEAKTDLQSHALSIRDEVSVFFEQVGANMLMVRSSIDSLQKASATERINPFLQEVVSQSRYLEAIYLLDDRLRVRSLGLPANLEARRRDYLQLDFSGLEMFNRETAAQVHAARIGSGITLSDSFVSLATGKPSVMMMTKLNDGYLLGTVDLDRLAGFLYRRMRQMQDMVFAVVDHNGTLVAHTDQQLALERTSYLAHTEIHEALVFGREVASKLHEDHSLLESVWIIPGSGWVVHASISRDVVMHSVHRLRTVLISTLCIAVVLGAGLAFWQARRVVRPLLRLGRTTQGVARGDYHAIEKIGRTGYAELDDLSANFVEMGAAVMERETFLRASEERYRSLIAGMGEGLLIVDRDGRVGDCNEAAERILDLPRKQIIGDFVLSRNWRVIREDGSTVPPEELPFSVTLKTGAVVDNKVLGLGTPDGRETWLQVNSRPQMSLHGEINAAVVTFADVTSLKVAEASLRLGKQRYQELFQQFSALLEGITDRIDLLDPQLRIVWSNHLEAGTLPGRVAELQGGCCYAIRFDRTDPCPECPVVRCFESGRREVGEVVDRQGCTWNLRAFPVKGQTGVANVVLIAEDITEKLESERQRNRASQLAALGELAAGVAHEINNPVSGVINYAQLIVNKTAEDAREHELARRIIKEGDRIATIVRELLTFAREESSDVKAVSIREALAEALSLCESHLRKEAIDLRIDLPVDLPRVESRSHQIQQLLLNLISNARHALSEKYPEPHAEKLLQITGRTIELDGRPFVRVKVRDHGTGIPQQLLEKVLNPFVTTKPAGIGTGLGLSISFEIAKRHGGSLTIASEYGAWTEVVIDLPAGPPAVQG